MYPANISTGQIIWKKFPKGPASAFNGVSLVSLQLDADILVGIVITTRASAFNSLDSRTMLKADALSNADARRRIGVQQSRETNKRRNPCGFRPKRAAGPFGRMFILIYQP